MKNQLILEHAPGNGFYCEAEIVADARLQLPDLEGVPMPQFCHRGLCWSQLLLTTGDRATRLHRLCLGLRYADNAN